MSKDSFLMYMSFREAIAELSTDEKGILLDAIFEYNSTGNVPEIPKMVKIVFSIMKHQFDRDSVKYQEILKRNWENGKLGGRPPTNPNKPRKPSGLIGNPVQNSGNPVKNSETLYDDDNVSDDVDVSESESDDVDVSVYGAGFSEIANFFESSSSSFPKVDFNDSYLKKLYYDMLKKHGIEKIKEAILNASESWYCTGHNEKGTIADLLWILTPKYFENLLSKKYANKGKFPEYNTNGTKVTDNQKNSFEVVKMMNDQFNNPSPNTPY